MRRSSKFKFYLETICGYLLVFIMLGAGVQLLYTGLSTSLDKAAKFQGRIQEIGIIRSKPSTSRFGTIQRNILAIKMDGLDGIYFIYNPQQNYASYLNLLRVGDLITIYYSHRLTSATELYEITKGKVTILRLKQFNFRQLLMGVIALTAGLLLGWRISRKVHNQMQTITQ